MAEPSIAIDANPRPDEIILAQFVSDLEQGGDGVLADYARRYPSLAQEFHSLEAVERLLRAPPAADPDVPRNLGEFFVLRRIASGGMGEIYEAVQQKLNRRVAIKTIRRGHIAPRARERFLREQRVLAKLHHTHIVPIHTAGEQGALQYFAMPFIDGVALHRVVGFLAQAGGEPAGSTPSIVTLAGLVAAQASPPAEPNPVLAPTRDAAPQHAVSQHAVSPIAAPDAKRPLSPAPRPVTAARPVSARRRLSLEYLRSVATVMADAADALAHAHDAHILHRDMKPSNIMVDAHGQCWLIDFGLAGYLSAGRDADPAEGETGETSETAASGLVGTLNYMAPEQLAGHADVRTDVWGLGVTLYELLTLQKAFPHSDVDLAVRITVAEPPPVEEAVAKVPADLAAICRKAMRKAPADRYQTARDFAADLRHWLRHEPTSARPGLPRRGWLFVRRNPLVSAATAGAVMALTGMAVALVWGHAHAVRRDRDRGAMLQLVSRARQAAHVEGWRQESLDHVRHAADARSDEILRSEVVATLAPCDAVLVTTLENTAASSLAFHPSGGHLLIGGALAAPRRKAAPARLWHHNDGPVRHLGVAGRGPVAISADGRLLGLLTTDSRNFSLWDIGGRRLLAHCEPSAAAAPNPTQEPLASLAANGLRMAIAFCPSNGEPERSTISVWNASGGTPALEIDWPATALALAPDGSLLAAGDRLGNARLWSLPDGEVVTTLRRGRAPILALAFQRDPLGHDLPAAADATGWLLASGGGGGALTVWDVAQGVPRSICGGSHHDVDMVSFRQDGALLAAGSHFKVRLFDVATGRLLLELLPQGALNGMAFSPDGRHFAVSAHYASPNDDQPASERVRLWRLEDGLGIRALRGLSEEVTKVRFSPSGRLVAAMSMNWQVAVWDVATGLLLRVFEAPWSTSADNAAIEFSPDETQLAFSAGGSATLWHLRSGRTLRRWSLPLALQDALAFHPKGGLLLVRAETADPSIPPYGNSPDRYPRVCRVRDLLAADPLQPLAEIADFNRRVGKIRFSPDGDYFVVGGRSGPAVTTGAIAAYNGLTGKKLWQEPVAEAGFGEEFVLDPHGRSMTMFTTRAKPAQLVEMPEKRLLDSLPVHFGIHAIAPGGRYFLRISGPEHGASGMELFARGESDSALLRLGIDAAAFAGQAEFNRSGTQIAMGDATGLVTLVDLADLRHRLADLGLDW